ncbi:MAG: DNA integrity scanning protein DisA nucleotide-binding domain protein [Candidatus Phytoplasma pruni]|nr:DNA integrity scanning protein DisA nucleotide-binding domain protein [Candidatus Phytoplasma pruni]
MSIPYVLKILLYIIIFCVFCVFSLQIFFSKYELTKIIYSFFLGTNCVYFINKLLNLNGIDLKEKLGFDIYTPLLTFVFIAPIVVKTPYLRYHLQALSKSWKSRKNVVMGSKNTQKNILDSVLELSKRKTGALITIEKYHSLEQFAQKSILIDGNVTKELLLNIFNINTPLHDGAVIIRGNKILSAGTYFMLSDNQHFEKITGSRHRAALGISEKTDSMTIVVSEETGDISIALEGIMLKTNDKNKIQEYLSMFML